MIYGLLWILSTFASVVMMTNAIQHTIPEMYYKLDGEQQAPQELWISGEYENTIEVQNVATSNHGFMVE
ncbi:hypothetical protein LIER_01671 [Lithospermum erythrorhizon]|uniref:Uncharacterized protein n=1 Tax=Lithospermum erythrorhizon TaxID=34254 RepID=A0AAV3NLQ0_LITER